MGEIIYFQRCNAPNGPNISSIIVKTYAKLKKSFRLVVLGYTWYFLIWGGLSLAPNPGKLKFLIGFLSKSSQYNINVWYELSFLWKSEPDWWSLSGVLDWCAIWSPPRYLHFQYMYFGPAMYFLMNILVESHLVAPALANNMVFSLKFVLLCQIYVYLNAAPQKRIWGQLKQILPNYRYCYIRCNFKTGSVRFSMCHLIFWPNVSIIDQHLVMVWCNLHVFLTIFTALYGWNNLFSEM